MTPVSLSLPGRHILILLIAVVLPITLACVQGNQQVDSPTATPAASPTATTVPLTPTVLPPTKTNVPPTPTTGPSIPTIINPTATAVPPTATAVPPTSVPTPSPLPDPVYTDISGTWKTTYGTMELKLNGSTPTGTYTTDNGVIFNASLSGRTLTGFWVEDASAANCGSEKDGRNFWGRISFEFNEDFTSFKGKWRWCDQNPTENWNGTRILTPTNTHFIAVGDRGVAVSVSPVFHYSLEYWQCGLDFTPLNYEPGFTPEDLASKCSDPKKLGEVELLAIHKWSVWAGYTQRGERKWVQPLAELWISEIVYQDTRATKIMPIYTGTAADVQARWTTIIGIAQSYQWGEQSGVSSGNAFTNWPRSMYKSLQTNSNTFVRYLVRMSGLTMTEMTPGLYEGHPGAYPPSQNTFFDLGRTLTFYPEHTPWLGDPPKDMPPGTPP